jgi:formylglycine-generating enzyme required for sulfatase activity
MKQPPERRRRRLLVLLSALCAAGVLGYYLLPDILFPDLSAGRTSVAGQGRAGTGGPSGVGREPGTGESAEEGQPPPPGEHASGRERKYDPQPASATGPAAMRLTNGAEIAAYGVEHAYLKTPLTFETDCSEYGGNFDFLARGAAFNVLFGPGEIILFLKRPLLDPKTIRTGAGTEPCHPRGQTISATNLSSEIMIRIRILDISPGAHATGISEAEKRTHYFVGNDPRRWLWNVPSYAGVQYANIYPGIDLSFYGDQERLEYVFVIWPGADPSLIHFSFEGSDETIVDESGNLVLYFEGGKIVQGAPLFYQIVDGIPQPVRGHYMVSGGEVRFAVERYEGTEPLYAAPALEFLSYLGGAGDDRGYAIALDGAGYAYVVGETASKCFPSARSLLRPNPEDVDVFLTKFRLSDSKALYTAFLGGPLEDRGFGVAADASGNAYVCGETRSADFPQTTPSAAASTNGSWDAFVAKLSPDGSNMLFSARLKGSGDERAYGIALDARSNVVIAGETYSDDFPVTNALQGVVAQPRTPDAFVAKLDASGAFFQYAARIGGSGEDAASAVAVDADGNVYLTGKTDSKDFPLQNPMQRVHGGGRWDAFVLRMTASTPPELTYSTYLGGRNDDAANGLAVDLAGNAYLTGETASDDFPVTNAVQSQHAGGDWDAFVVKLFPDGTRPVYATYFGGSGKDRGFGIAPDISGHAHVVGATTSTNLPIRKAVQLRYGGGLSDGFAVKLDPVGASVAYATYFGGPRNDYLHGVAVDPARRVHVCGTTSSTNLPVVQALQSEHKGGRDDALLGRLLPEPQAAPPLRLVPGGGQPDGPAYDFYISTFEISNDEFARFLNDAQANTNDARGTNMFFDADGNVWFNPAMIPEKHEMLDISKSRLVYIKNAPVGGRYAVTPRVPSQGASYSNHPVVGVSWFGAVKYCNWLTLDTGRGLTERCYREGTNEVDWAPVTVSATNWARGLFGTEERRRWLTYTGFRLPMDNCSGTNNSPNPFNEFYKAGAWGGRSNVVYGFGRDLAVPGDANYLDSGALLRHDTTPVGFFNGSNRTESVQTRTNENLYGIFDLSGNITEWLTDLGYTNSMADRACYGGSWRFELSRLTDRFYVSPFFTDSFVGFRVVTTASDQDLFLIRIPYRICLCGWGEAEAPSEKPEVPKRAPELGPSPLGVPGTNQGVLYRPTTTTIVPTTTTTFRHVTTTTHPPISPGML